MSLKQMTGIIILATIVILVGYDIFAYVHGGEATISEWFWAESKIYPFIPFCFGILMGHLFAKGSSS